MNLVPSDSGSPFKFQRRQFSISLCFAMIINKSQGQSLSKLDCVIYDQFSHMVKYIVVSRFKIKKGLNILIWYEDKNATNTTKNVV